MKREFVIRPSILLTLNSKLICHEIIIIPKRTNANDDYTMWQKFKNKINT